MTLEPDGPFMTIDGGLRVTMTLEGFERKRFEASLWIPAHGLG